MLSWRQVLGFLREELPIAAMSQLALLLGGLVLLAFFVRLGFMPEISLESVLSLFYAVAMLGLSLMVLMVSALVLPAILLRRGLPWLEDGLPQGGGVVLSTVAAVGLWFLYFLAWVCLPSSAQPWLKWGLWASLILALVIWAVVYLGKGAWRRRPRWLYGAAGAQQFVVLSLPLWIVVTLLAGGDLGHAEPWQAFGMFGLLLLVLAIITAAQTLLMDQSWLQTLGLAFAFLLLVVMATGSAGYLLDGFMARLQWGNVQPVRAVLTRTGCDQLNLAAGRTVCHVPTAADALAAVCHLNIRSRIGSQVLLASMAPPASAASSVPSSAGWQVVLDRKELLAWSVDSADCLPDSSARPASAAP